MKRLYYLLSLLAMINLFAVVGLVGYLFSSGRLNADRVNQIAVVLRGEFPTSQPAATQPVEAPPPPQRSREEIVRIQAQKEFYDLIAERHKREMEDRRSLNQAVQLDVERQLEELDRKRKQFADEKKTLLSQAAQDGFERELELFNTMDAKQAKELLRKRKDPDAVQLMMKMDSNRVKKIVDGCKSEDEKTWIGRILLQIQNVSKDSANGVDGPVASFKGG